MNPLEQLGIKRNKKGNFAQTLFYFIREFKLNPLEEEYEILPEYEDGKIIRCVVKKKGMPLPLFNTLIEEMQEHYKREEMEMKKVRRR